jgi:predicted dehydrogenase
MKDIKTFFKRLQSKNLQLWFDVANFYRVGDQIFYNDLVSLKNNIRYFHLKDFILKNNNVEYVPLGNGSINYKRIFSDIKSILKERDIFLSLETHVKINTKIATLESLRNLRKLLNQQRISYGVIGCGRVFKKHALAISNDGNSELRAAFDINEKRTEAASKTYDCEMKKSLKDLLNDLKIQVVNICTPHHTHKDLILKTIAVNKYCLCEKPLCLSKEDGKEILNNENYKNNIFVVLQNRFNPAIQFLFKLIKKNLFGKIRLCSVNVRWWRENNYFKDEWHGDIKRVGGMLFNQGIHVLDLMRKICGEPIKIQKIIKRLRSFSTVDDIFVANIIFKSGIIGNVEINTYTKYRNFEASIFIIGDKGSIKIGGPELNKVEYLDIKNKRILREFNRYCEEIEEKYGKGHQRLITAFSKYLLGSERNPNLVSAKEGVVVTEFIEKLYKS